MKVKKRILLISNYPIKRPLHGGQKRAAAIIEEYKKHFTDVRFVAIFVREHYPIYAKSDLYLTGKWAHKVIHDHFTSDIQIAHAMKESPRLRKKIVRMLQSFNPEVIQFEQPFAYLGLKPILEELNMQPDIVYGSQNVEAPMREDLMKIIEAPKKEITAAVNTIDELETELVRTASITSVVSQRDGEYYLKKGAKKYTLAPNGISRSEATPSSTNYWNKFLRERGVKQIALFVASAHLPNMQAVKNIIGLRLGFLPTDTRLVLAGSVGRNLHDNFDRTKLLDQPFWQRTINAGTLSESMLAALIERADILLLPVVDGGGSNLKTAEAILSGKKIVATKFAFRGYEQYLSLPNIWVADTPSAFRRAVTEALGAPLKPRTEAQEKIAKKVQWKYCLSPLIDEVKKL